MKPLELEFLNGPRAGERIYLAEGRLRFGRSSSNEVPIQWDRMVSSHHCHIVYESEHYILEDLESTNGTFVNSEPIRRWQLANADRITIGKTSLKVELEVKSLEDSHRVLPPLGGGPPANSRPFDGNNPLSGSSSQLPEFSAGSEPRKAFNNPLDSGVFTSALAARSGPQGSASSDSPDDNLSDYESPVPSTVGSTLRAAAQASEPESSGPQLEQPQENPPDAKQPRSLQVVQATEQPLASQLYCVTGNWPDFSDDAFWLSLFRKEKETTYAIVDLSKAADPIAKKIEEKAVSFLDHPTAAASRFPVLVNLFETDDWEDWIRELWDCNAVVLLQTAMSMQDLSELLRNMTQVDKPRESGRGVLGIVWPNVLAAMLRANYEPVIQQLFPRLTFVLIEREDEPDHWQLFCSEASVPKLYKPWLKVQKASS